MLRTLRKSSLDFDTFRSIEWQRAIKLSVIRPLISDIGESAAAAKVKYVEFNDSAVGPRMLFSIRKFLSVEQTATSSFPFRTSRVEQSFFVISSA